MDIFYLENGVFSIFIGGDKYRGRGGSKYYPIELKFFLGGLYTQEIHWFKEEQNLKKSPKNGPP
jgi:hypothetical protein